MFILYGGSFDPVHTGHILLARDAKEIVGAERVLFMPTYLAPLKEKHSASAEDRLNMLRLALEQEEGFEVSDYEVKKGGVSYTVDTLRHLRSEGLEKPFLLLGADSALRLHLWKESLEVFRLSVILIAEREGRQREVISYMKERFPHLKEGKDYLLIKTRRVDISATEIRNRIREGKSIYCLVPDKVRSYIEDKNLYR